MTIVKHVLTCFIRVVEFVMVKKMVMII